MKIIFWVLIVIAIWLGLRHLISALMGYSSHGELKAGQWLCHLTSMAILWSGAIIGIKYQLSWIVILAIVLELIFRNAIIASA